ncbi:MAG: cell division protein ZapA [Christensenellales bacterium]|jgi:cell division protein ZapA
MEKKKTVVKIAGKEYTMSGYETEEYMRRVAAYVDGKIGELKKNYFILSTSMTSVLAAANIADELFKAQEENLLLQEKNKYLREELRELQKPSSGANSGAAHGLRLEKDRKVTNKI